MEPRCVAPGSMCGVVRGFAGCVFTASFAPGSSKNLEDLMEAAHGPPSAWSPVALENGKRRKGWDLWYTGPARVSWKWVEADV